MYNKIIQQSKETSILEDFDFDLSLNIELLQINLSLILWYMKSQKIKQKYLDFLISKFIKDLEAASIELGFAESGLKKKVRKLALAHTLSKKNSDNNLFILSDVKKEIKKTKEFNNFLKKNNLMNVIIISDVETLKNINRSARNIKNLKIINDAGANIYDMLKYKNVLLTQSSVKNLEKRILNEKN